MRTSKSTEIKVGAFIVIILALFAVSIFVIGSHQEYFQRQYTLWASFSNIRGLIVGAPVRLAGVTVGRVSAIYFPEDIEQKTVKVEMKINRGIRDRIREDSTATIQTMGLLGDKYVEITLGSPDKKVLEDRTSMKCVEPIDLFSYAYKTEAAIDAINTILLDIKEISTQIKSGEGFLHSVLYDPAGAKLVRNLSAASTSLDDLIQKLSDTSSKAIGAIDTILLDIREFSTQVKSGKGFLHAALYDPAGAELVRNLSAASASLDDLIQKLSYTASSLNTIVGKGAGDLVENLSVASASLDDLMKELSSIAQSLNNIVKKVEKGEGSLGGIINDPTVYEDLKVILGGAKRSEAIKGVIRYTIKKKREEGIDETER
jgi:phospholipid/cholesterol/gamma-HCH transport system substrate-binding protein